MSTTTKLPVVALKNLKHYPGMSEETCAFRATVYFDGAKVGEVSNDGHGSAHRYSPWEIEHTLIDIARAMPKRTADIGGGRTCDTVIDDLVDLELGARDLKKLLKCRVVFTLEGKPGLYRSNTIDVAKLAKIVADPALMGSVAAKLNAHIVLNIMPFHAALALYRGRAIR